MQIIFGTKKLGQAVEKTSNDPFESMSVVTVEAQKESGKSRRILFNDKAAKLLSLESGSVQEVVFGCVTGETNKLFIASAFPEDDSLVTYRVSKNPVARNDENYKSKAKSISSSHMSNEIVEFLELNQDENNNFELVSVDTGEDNPEVFELIHVTQEKEQSDTPLSDALAQMPDSHFNEKNDESFNEDFNEDFDQTDANADEPVNDTAHDVEPDVVFEVEDTEEESPFQAGLTRKQAVSDDNILTEIA